MQSAILNASSGKHSPQKLWKILVLHLIGVCSVTLGKSLKLEIAVQSRVSNVIGDKSRKSIKCYINARFYHYYRIYYFSKVLQKKLHNVFISFY